MKVLVCGGRKFRDKALMWETLDNLEGITRIIHGGSTGADAGADMWAKERGIPVSVYPALWNKHGFAAGPIRNGVMLKDAKPDLVVAFPGGRGTDNMVKQACKAKVTVIHV